MAYVEFIVWLKETWPHPPDSVLARLRHTLDVYDESPSAANEPDDELVLTATSGTYRDERDLNVKTGLAWGDLRAIREFLGYVEGERKFNPFGHLTVSDPGPGKRTTIR